MISHRFFRRRGATYLEIQVAMVMLALGVSGLYSMSVVQTRQSARLTETLPPADVAAINQATSPWQRKLGVYASIDSVLVPPTQVGPTATTSLIVDNEDSSVQFVKAATDPFPWIVWTPLNAHGPTARYHRSTGSVGSYVRFNAAVPNGEYEVLITYPNFSVCGTAIECEIYDGSSLLDAQLINQTTAPNDETHLSRPWDSLGTYQVSNNSISVQLSDGPGSEQFIIADAIWVRPRKSLEVVSLSASADGGATVVLEAAP